MCGIAGLLEFKADGLKESPGKILRIMLDYLAHRGPDDRGEERLPVENGPTLYLGHQRLSIIDLTPAGHQPMCNDDQSLWIATNSEVYNYRELRKELSSKYVFHSQSDTEVLLKAYQEWDVHCLEKLRGMFAFAIWDAPRKRLFLARDRMGIKPLYYFAGKECFLFASEVRALKASGIPPCGINAEGLYHYLSFGSLSSPGTLLDSVQEIKPAHYLLVDMEGIREQCYWSPLGREVPPGDFQTPDQIRRALEESVRLRMISDVPVGAFLSGGIDSTAVTGLMGHHTPHPVKTLSVVFKEKGYDESGYSRLAAQTFGTDHHVLQIGEAELLSALPDAVSAMDLPTVDGINTFFISRAAREMGWKVALSGLGGDEVFCGYDSFRLLPKILGLESFLQALPRFCRSLAGSWLKRLQPTTDRGVKFAHLVSDQKNGSHAYFLFRALFCEDRVRDLFVDKDLMNQQVRKALETTRELFEPIRSMGLTEQISYLELRHYLGNTLLRDTDMMSMAHGLEVRVPLIDHQLVELMFSIPGRMKLNGRAPKSLLVDSMSGVLPDKVVHRKKMGFTLPFETWMRSHLKKEIEQVLFTPVAPLSDFLSEAGVRKVWEDFLAHRVTWSRPWALFVLKQWVDRNFSQQTALS